MSDFRQDRKFANPLLNKIFPLWHGSCVGLCERISETSSMVMRTENAVAAVKTALSPAIKPANRRVMVEPGDCASFKHLNGLGKRLASPPCGHPEGRKGHTSSPRRRHDPSIVTALECSGLHSTTRTRWTNSRKPVGTKARKRPRGAQWLWPILAANKPPSGKTL